MNSAGAETPSRGVKRPAMFVRGLQVGDVCKGGGGGGMDEGLSDRVVRIIWTSVGNRVSVFPN